METIGKRLRTARETRGLSIEDVAHETRIQSIYIQGLENDDYSNFASTTYAKSFLTLYSRFLEVNAEEALLQFAGGDSLSLAGQGYLEAVTAQIQPQGSSTRRPYFSSGSSAPKKPSNSNSPGMAPIFLGVILLLLVAAIPIMWYVGNDSDSIEEAGSKLGELAKKAKLTNSEPAGQAPAAPQSAAVEPEEKVGPDPSRIKPLTTELPSAFPEGTPKSPAAARPVTGPDGKPIAIPVRALPVTEIPETPAESDPGSAGSSSVPNPPPGVEPIRAKPILAVPVAIPVETEPEEESEADPEESSEEGAGEPVAKPREDGNLFPRPE